MIKITIMAMMAIFYIAYFAKQIAQRRQGVSTMILGKGDKPANQKRLELALKVATFTMPAVEIASMWWELMTLPCWLQWMGVVIAAVGVGFFIAGMLTMKGSWRAGIPEKKETSLVTSGILLAFPNAWHAAAVAITLVLFHKQILGEEYTDYKKRVRRYL